MKKLFSTLLFLSFLLAGTLALEGKNKPVFLCKAVLAGPKDIFFCGATIPFTLTLQYPAGYRICGWSLYAYEKHLPENFAKNTNRKVSNPKNPKWSSVPLKKVTWLPTALRTHKTHSLQFSTEGFPPGDYRVSVSCVFQGKNQQGKTLTLYRSATLPFSLEEKP